MISSDDIRKSINPTDAELEAFFKKNAARYANAVPEERTISYFAFTPNDVPGGVQQPTQQEIEAYYNAHKSEYSVPEQAKSRHILIQVAPGADAKTDAAAKAKAEDILKQLQKGANFADLAKKYSDDPGSKDSGGELGFAQRGHMVPEFDKAIFTQKIGDYEDREDAVRLSHCAGGRADGGARAVAVRSAADDPGDADSPEVDCRAGCLCAPLTSEAIKNGLDKTAAAHHLQVVTTPPVNASGCDSGAARWIAVDCARIWGEADRSAAVGAHGRGLCDLPGEERYSGACADVCGLEEPR